MGKHSLFGSDHKKNGRTAKRSDDSASSGTRSGYNIYTDPYRHFEILQNLLNLELIYDYHLTTLLNASSKKDLEDASKNMAAADKSKLVQRFLKSVARQETIEAARAIIESEIATSKKKQAQLQQFIYNALQKQSSSSLAQDTGASDNDPDHNHDHDSDNDENTSPKP